MRRWTETETQKAIMLRNAGHSITEIARELPDRGNNAVIGMVFRLRRKGSIHYPAPGAGRASRFGVLTRHAVPQSTQSIVATANQLTHSGMARGEAFRTAWHDARIDAGDMVRSYEPRTLRSYVMMAGGIVPSKRTRQLPVCYLRRDGVSADVMAALAADQGYATGRDGDVLVEMLTSGDDHYSANDLDVTTMIGAQYAE